MEQNDQTETPVVPEDQTTIRIRVGWLEGAVYMQPNGHHYLKLPLKDDDDKRITITFSMTDLLRLSHLFEVAVETMTEVKMITPSKINTDIGGQ